MEKRIQIYLADMGNIRKPENHKFIAEFADQKISSYYVDYLFKKYQGKKKDIIIKEYELEERPTASIVGVLAATGEYIPKEEINLD